jgi:hypothetical protein
MMPVRVDDLMVRTEEGIPMRLLILVGSFSLAVAGVHAQSSVPSEGPAPKPQISGTQPKSEAAKPSDNSAEYLAQCLRDWDAATHMTKQEWARTCRRVVENRAKFMREQMK